MQIQVSIDINAPKEKVWSVITDIEGSASTISGINKVEVLEQPDSGVVGLKWRETRTMFGKEATVVMWITDAEPNLFYKTRAENHGMIYVSELRLEGVDGATRLTMGFHGEVQKFSTNLMSIMGWFFRGSTKKAMQQDLEDIKRKAEAA